MSKSLTIVVLGAGKGTRMKSNLPKVLHEIAGRKMINLVLDTALELDPEQVVVVISPEMVKPSKVIQGEYNNLNLQFVVQEHRLGTAHAVQVALDSLRKISDIVLVLYADTPLLDPKTLNLMIKTLSPDAIGKKSADDQLAVCILGFDFAGVNPEENKYGRLITKKDKLDSIVEFRDATPQEKKIALSNSGVVAINGSKIKELLALVKNDNASKEYYLTDIIAIANAKKLSCCFLRVAESEVMGVNSRADLARAEKIKQDQIRNSMMENGVTLTDPSSVYFSYDTKIASDVVINPNVFFGKGVVIESSVEIKPFCHIEGAHIFDESIIGPFARIRPKTIIHSQVRIGNFVEVKKSEIKSRTKISHLSYVGDAEIGSDSNVGAGTIFCNYDGYQKFETKVGKNVFIGSNAALVAPLEIGDNVVVAAGSVITKNVATNDLVVSRGKLIELKDGGKKYHQKKKNNENA